MFEHLQGNMKIPNTESNTYPSSAKKEIKRSKDRTNAVFYVNLFLHHNIQPFVAAIMDFLLFLIH